MLFASTRNAWPQAPSRGHLVETRMRHATFWTSSPSSSAPHPSRIFRHHILHHLRPCSHLAGVAHSRVNSSVSSRHIPVDLGKSRYGKDGSHLRLEEISVLDSERVRTELQAALTCEQDGGNSVDWGSITQVATECSAGRFEYLRSLFSQSTTFADAFERAAIARTQEARIHAAARPMKDVGSWFLCGSIYSMWKPQMRREPRGSCRIAPRPSRNY